MNNRITREAFEQSKIALSNLHKNLPADLPSGIFSEPVQRIFNSNKTKGEFRARVFDLLALEWDPERAAIKYNGVEESIHLLIAQNKSDVKNIMVKHGVLKEPTVENIIYTSGKLGKSFVRDLLTIGNNYADFEGLMTEEELEKWNNQYNDYYKNGGTGTLEINPSTGLPYNQENNGSLDAFLKFGIDLIDFGLNYFRNNGQAIIVPPADRNRNLQKYAFAGVVAAALFIIVLSVKK